MVYRFLIRHAHGTSVNNNSLATSKIINRENPPSQGDPTKAYNPWGAFIFQILERGGRDERHTMMAKKEETENTPSAEALYILLSLSPSTSGMAGWLRISSIETNSFTFVIYQLLLKKKRNRKRKNKKEKRKSFDIVLYISGWPNNQAMASTAHT